jgi:hypothetical protein
MRSHSYDFVPGDVARLLWPTLAFVALAAGLFHAATRLSWLPRPRPTLDVDRTIVIHKTEASGSRQDAEVLLMGDSSCLMDLSAVKLTTEIGRPVLNLGTLSYLDLKAHGTLLRRFVAVNPNQPKAVVLLLHPEALRRPAPEQYHTAVFEHFVAGKDHVTKLNLAHWLGLEFFRTRLLSRALPTPLGGAYGQRYGFSSDLQSYLTRHRGSAIDPDPKPFQGNPEYRLAPQLESQSRAFKSAVPRGVKLFVAITPVPAGFAPPNYARQHRQVLEEWSQWLGADAALVDLPPTLPDGLFAKTTHLNEAGAVEFTMSLARSLSAKLGPQPRQR